MHTCQERHVACTTLLLTLERHIETHWNVYTLDLIYKKKKKNCDAEMTLTFVGTIPNESKFEDI